MATACADRSTAKITRKKHWTTSFLALALWQPPQQPLSKRVRNQRETLARGSHKGSPAASLSRVSSVTTSARLVVPSRLSLRIQPEAGYGGSAAGHGEPREGSHRLPCRKPDSRRHRRTGYFIRATTGGISRRRLTRSKPQQQPQQQRALCRVPRQGHSSTFLADIVLIGGGVLIIMHSRSRMTIDPRSPTMPGWSTSGFHRPGGHR